MGKRKREYHPELLTTLPEYAKDRYISFKQFSPWHMRMSDEGVCTVDIWTSSKYYVLDTDYVSGKVMTITERAGEKGTIPINREKMFIWLDTLFFPESTS